MGILAISLKRAPVEANASLNQERDLWSEGRVKIYNVKMVKTEMACAAHNVHPPKTCQNQQILLDSFKPTPKYLPSGLHYFISSKTCFRVGVKHSSVEFSGYQKYFLSRKRWEMCSEIATESPGGLIQHDLYLLFEVICTISKLTL